MSVCGQSGQTEEDSASEEAGAAARELHKQKPASKVVRVLTVLAYLLSVSLAAILLSVYYVCAWTSPELPRNVSQVGALTGDQNHAHVITGGSDTTVNNTTPGPANISTESTDSSVVTGEVTSPTTDPGAPLTKPRDLNHSSTSENIGSFNETDSVT